MQVRFKFLLAALFMASLSPLAMANENIRQALNAKDFTFEVIKPDGSLVAFNRQSGMQKLQTQPNQSYLLRLTNTTNERIMVVAAIDGLDPDTGKQALIGQAGHVIDPGKSLLLSQRKVDKKTQAQPLQLDPTQEVGVIDIVAFRERMDYPHLVPWSPGLAARVGGEVRPGPVKGTQLWLPPSGAPFRRLARAPSSSLHVEYGQVISIFSHAKP